MSHARSSAEVRCLKFRMRKRENERDYPEGNTRLIKASLPGVTVATLTYKRDDRPWSDACVLGSLRLSLLRLRVISQRPLTIRFLQSKVSGGLLLHRTAQVDISDLFTRRPQPKGAATWCHLHFMAP